jgi:poly(A) polymerase
LTRRDRLAGLVTVEGVVAAANPVRRLAALMDGGANVDDIVARLRLSNRDGQRLRDLKTGAVDINPDLPQDAWKSRLYKVGADRWREVVLLNWAGELADGHTDDHLRVDAWRALMALPQTWPVPALPVRGADVIEAGVPEGPEVSRLLKDIESWWIDGGLVADRDACLSELARRAVV